MKGIQNTSTNNFSTIIGNNKKFIVPKFQRDYSWETEQWDDLWNDILNAIDCKDDHYMGYLVLQTEDDKIFQIIDGQQRFTTITIIILAALKCITKLSCSDSEKTENEIRVNNFIHTFIGKKDSITLEYDNILKLNRNNDDYYRDYIVKLGDLKVRNIKNSEKLMKKCFEFFEQKLKNRYSSGKDYAEFIQFIADNLYFTQIVVSDEVNAFRVFETLNARGVQLSSSDLLKNYLFSLVDSANSHRSHIELLEEKWAKLTDNIKSEKMPEFIRYYWNTKHKSIRANAVFKTIRKEISSDTKVFELVNDMLQYSDVYMALTDSNDILWGNDRELRQNIALLNLFRLKQPFSLLMSAFKNLPVEKFKELLKRIVTICFRYNVICDKNPNDQETPFNELAIHISNGNQIDYQLLQTIVIDDHEFQMAFEDKAFPYNSRNAKIIRYILGRIEKFKGSSSDVWFDDDNASIEHILPQNFINWDIDETQATRMLYKLGNTCILELKLNKELQDANFEAKKEIYKKSAFLYAKTIADLPTWDENVSNKIQHEMAKAAVSIWRV